jgi:anti-sigma regulatory factor (Ser/Thr protein kinase)
MPPSDGKQRHASLIVDNELRELPRVNAWVQDWAKRQQLPRRVAHNLDLCSTEVLTNIMSHGCSESAQRILLRLRWQGEDVALEVEDDGVRFDPRQVPEPARATSLQDARIGGWGIPMVRHFSDGLQYRREGGHNRLTLLFRATAPH